MPETVVGDVAGAEVGDVIGTAGGGELGAQNGGLVPEEAVGPDQQAKLLQRQQQQRQRPRGTAQCVWVQSTDSRRCWVM